MPVLGTVARRLIYFRTSDCSANATRRTRVRHDRINSLFGDERLCLMSSYYYLIFNAMNNIEEKLCFMLFVSRFSSAAPPIYIWRRAPVIEQTNKADRRCSFPKRLSRRPTDRLLLKSCFGHCVKIWKLCLLLGVVEAWHGIATSPVFFCLCAI